jgi:predicted glycogen debranching enzyme
VDRTAEWLEADGLGGFASGTASGIRTRRYHALLLAAMRPPTDRIALVNGFDAWVNIPSGSFALSSHRYLPDVVHPDGARRIIAFEPEPWPRWTFELEDGTRIEQELFVRHGTPVVVLSWRLMASRQEVTLSVRPFLSGRDYHSLHHENPSFRFEPVRRDDRITWRPYPGIPGIVVASNGDYLHQPDWYRNFLYDEERARGLDYTEDLAAPGIFRWNLSSSEAGMILVVEGEEANALPSGLPAEACLKSLRAAEHNVAGNSLPAFIARPMPI